MVHLNKFLSLSLFLIALISSSFYSEKGGYSTIGITEPEIHKELNNHLNLFKSIRLHLENGEIERAKALDKEIEKSMQFIENWVQSRNGLARAVNVQFDRGSDISQLIESFLDTGSTAGSKRMDLSMNWPLFLENYVSTEKMVEVLDEFLEVHEELIQTGRDFYLMMMESSIQVNVYKWLYVQKRIGISPETNCSSEFIIENIHHKPLTNIRIDLENMAGQNGANIGARPATIESLEPGSFVKFEMCFSDYSSADGMFRLQVQSDQGVGEELARFFND